MRGCRPGGSPTVDLTDDDEATATFTAPNLTEDTLFTFTLTVTAAGDPVSATNTVDVTIQADNDDPTADAGADQTVFERSAVTLSGANSSDLDNQDLLFLWLQTGGSPTVSLVNADSASASFIAPNLAGNATLTFTLTVTAGGASVTDTVEVTILGQNNDPTSNAGADQTVAKGAVVRLSGSGSDSEGQTLTYSWSQTGGRPTVILWKRRFGVGLVHCSEPSL